MEFMQNLTEMRLTSMRNGNSNMSLDEINAEINTARKEKEERFIVTPSGFLDSVNIF